MINYEMIVFSGFYSESETVTGKVAVLNLESPQSGVTIDFLHPVSRKGNRCFC